MFLILHYDNDNEDGILKSLHEDIQILNKEKNKIFKQALISCSQHDNDCGTEKVNYSLSDVKVLSCGGYNKRGNSRTIGLELVVSPNNKKRYDVCFEFIKFDGKKIDIGNPEIEVL